MCCSAKPGGSGDGRDAASELLLLLLSEWMSGGSAEMVMHTLRLWQGGSCGKELVKVGKLELEQASHAGLDFECP